MFAELSVSAAMFNRHLIPVCLFRWFGGYPYDHKPKVDCIIDSLMIHDEILMIHDEY